MKRKVLVRNIAQFCVGDGNIQVAASEGNRGAQTVVTGVSDEYIDTLKEKVINSIQGFSFIERAYILDEVAERLKE
jgi:hypothetical protein